MDNTRNTFNVEIDNGKQAFHCEPSIVKLTITDKISKRVLGAASMEIVHSKSQYLDDGCTALHLAAKEGNVSMAKFLIDKGIDINAKSSDDKTSLYEAAHWGREAMVRFLIQRGANLSCRTKRDGWLAIHTAAARGHRVIVKLFLDEGIDVNAKNFNAKTALFEASCWGQDAVVAFLIGRGADLSSMTKVEGWQAIHIAAAKGHGTIVKQLLDSGVDINVNNVEGRTSLFEASYWGHDSVVRLLLGRGADVHLNTKTEGWSPLHVAAAKGHGSIVRLLLDTKVNIDVYNIDNRTPLFEAAYWGNESVVKSLIEWGAKINSTTKCKGLQPIHAAASRGHPLVIECLLDHGADINALDLDGRTPLLEAAHWGRCKVVGLLISKGADMNARTRSNGCLALHTAAERGHLAIVRLLLEQGVDINSKTFDDKTPLIEAAHWGQAEVVKLLIEKGADIAVTTKSSGWTALHVAASRGQTEVVILLLDKEDNVNVRSKEYKTPLYEAVFSGHYETAQVLINRGANKHARTTNGETILAAAKLTNNQDIIDLLQN